jgi:nucleolar protein 53
MSKVKKKHVSMKKKSSWRKHTNIQDVEDFLEEKRLEERIGM